MNSVNLIGRLTKPVEVKQTNGAQPIAVANFTIAVDKRLSKQEADQRKAAGQPTADFINCVAWRQSATYLGQYATQGTMVAVSGQLQTRTYQNQNGQNVYVTEVVCDQVKILSSNKNGAQPNAVPNNVAPNYAAPSQAPVQNVAPQQAPVANNAAPQMMQQPAPAPVQQDGVYLDISQDDLPFY